MCNTCYADTKVSVRKKRAIKHEEAHAGRVFRQVKILFPKLPEKLLFAVPSGGSRHKIETANMKRQGVKAGVADVILLVPKKGYASLYLEFKTSTGRQCEGVSAVIYSLNGVLQGG